MINKKIISSFLPTFFIASSIGIVIIIGFWMQGSSNADILSEQTSSEFKRALGANNEIFFKNISNNNENWGNEVLNTYPQKMDIEVIQNNNLLFFSFLGLKEKSSILHSIS